MATAPTTDRAAWLAERKTGIGASEAGAILGVCPWRTPLEVYLDKTDTLPERDVKTRQRFGLLYEDAIARAYSEDTGREITRPPAMVLRHPEHPFMLASLDFLTADGRRAVEIKKVNAFGAGEFGPAGSDQIPSHYLLQVQQQMAVAGVPVADLAALIGDNDFRVYTIEFQPAIVARLVEVERDFWGRVERRDPPLPDFSHPTTADLLALLEPEYGTAVELGADAVALADEYEALGHAAKIADAERRSCKARLLHAMGDAEVAHLPDGRRLTRKLIRRAAYQVAESQYVDFRVVQPKACKAKEPTR